MELILSKRPLRPNQSCASCGNVFNSQGLTLQLKWDHQVVDFPLCQRCFDAVPLFEATVNPELGSARVKR